MILRGHSTESFIRESAGEADVAIYMSTTARREFHQRRHGVRVVFRFPGPMWSQIDQSGRTEIRKELVRRSRP
jgi:hypothetical protein